MLHIRNEMKKFITELRVRHCGSPVYFNFELESDDYEEYRNEQTRQEFDDWQENYAIAIIDPVDEGDDPYMSFDSDKFHAGIKNQLNEIFGEDISVEHHKNSNEYEVQRKTRKNEI